MDGAILLANELYNVLAAYKADKGDDGKYIVRGNITSFMGAGDEFVVDSSAQYRVGEEWRNLLVAIKSTSYFRPITVF